MAKKFDPTKVQALILSRVSSMQGEQLCGELNWQENAWMQTAERDKQTADAFAAMKDRRQEKEHRKLAAGALKVAAYVARLRAQKCR